MSDEKPLTRADAERLLTNAKRKHRYGCWRCGRNDANGVKMIGDFESCLCPDCRNVWDEYISQHPDRIAFGEVGVRGGMLVARTQADGIDRTEEVMVLVWEQERLRRVLFEIAKAWCAEEQE
jgi:hypothetical protein